MTVTGPGWYIDDMAVRFFDMKRHLAPIRRDMVDAVERVVDGGEFILGPDVDALEREVAKYVGALAAAGVSSGTDALVVALTALGVGPGDEVVVPTFTFFATAGAVHRLGARIRFADIDPDTFNLDPERALTAAGDTARVIVPVHLFGQMADVEPLVEWASRRGDRAVVEDAAQSIGARGPAGAAGCVGTCGTFSFFPAKNLGGIGDGGMVVSNDQELVDRVKLLRSHGARPRYHHAVVGGNFRLDTIHAAVLRRLLPHLDAWTARRRANARRYAALFRDAGLEGAVRLPGERDGYVHVWNQFVVRVADREALAAHLRQYEIGHAVYYPVPLHMQPCFGNLGYEPGDFPVAEQACRETLALPIFPELTSLEQEEVVGVIRDFHVRYGGLKQV